MAQRVSENVTIAVEKRRYVDTGEEYLLVRFGSRKTLTVPEFELTMEAKDRLLEALRTAE